MAGETTIRSLLIRLGVKTDQAAVAKFDRGLAGVKLNMTLAVANAVALSGALLKVTMDAAKLGDESAKTSKQLGITAEEFQEYTYAAERAGATSGDIFTAFKKQARVVQDVADGSAEYALVLGDLGIKSGDPRLQQPAMLFEAMAAGLKKLGPGTKQTSRAQEVWGKGALKLIPLINDEKSSIADLRAEARALGLVIGNEAAAKAEEFQDRLLDAKMAVRGLRNTIGLALVPEVTRLMTKFRDWFVVNRKLIDQKVGKWADDISRGFKTIVEFGSKTDKVIQAFGGWGVILKGIGALLGVITAAKFIAPFFTMASALASVAGAGTTAWLVLALIVGGATMLAYFVSIFVAWAVVIQDVVLGLKGIDSVTSRVIKVIRDLRYWLSTGDSTMRRLLVTSEALGGKWAWLAGIIRSVMDGMSWIARNGFDIGGANGTLGSPLGTVVPSAVGNRTVSIGGNTFNIEGGKTNTFDIQRQVDEVMQRRNRQVADAATGAREL